MRWRSTERSAKALIVLRLTYQKFKQTTTSQLFRTFSLTSPLEFGQILIVGGSDSVDGNCDLLDESESTKSYEMEKHREKCKALMVLRLTCKKLEQTTTSQLFRTFCLTLFLEFLANIHSWRK